MDVLTEYENCMIRMNDAEKIYNQAIDNCVKITASYEQSTGSQNYRKNEEKMIKANDSYSIYIDSVSAYLDARKKAVKMLDEALDSGKITVNEWQIITYRIIDSLKWKSISENTGMSTRNCMILLKSGTAKLNRM